LRKETSHGGGNLDTWEVTAGAQVHLSVFFTGARLGLGALQAATDDGEICGTEAETRSTVTMQVEVRRPQFRGTAL